MPPKRDYNRYNKLCMFCGSLIRTKNLARHMRDEHPFGSPVTYVPCLVSSIHLRNIPQPPPVAGTSTNETQSELTIPPHDPLYGSLARWTVHAYHDLVERLLIQAATCCFTCTTHGEFESFFNDYAGHSDGCRAPAAVIISRYLPALLKERGILDVGEVVIATGHVNQLLSLECMRRGH